MNDPNESTVREAAAVPAEYKTMAHYALWSARQLRRTNPAKWAEVCRRADAIAAREAAANG